MSSSPSSPSLPQVQYISTTNIKPAPQTDSTQQILQLQLTPWDLILLPIQYIQKGLLFMKPKKNETNLHIHHLKTTFSQVLTHFFPLAGRFDTTFHDEDNTITVYINCNSIGAEFIHATAEITLSEFLDSVNVPSIVHSFFPLNGVTNYDGRMQPLLSVQVTELIDGIFIGCSMNHSACDGVTFWHFMNSWSEICRSSLENPNYRNEISRYPVFKPWFINESDLPIRFPFINNDDGWFAGTRLEQRFFHFSPENIAKLKSKANSESGSEKIISSFQALLAHVWIAAIRAKGLDSNEVTHFIMPMANRSRLNPPLCEEYFGNSVNAGFLQVKVGDMLEKGLGFTALLLNEVVETHNDESIRSSWKSWMEKPFLLKFSQLPSNLFNFGGSSKFKMYENDFGWGRPITMRSGCANKFDGKMEIYPGIVEGSVDIEVCFPLKNLKAMGDDAEFVEAVTILPPFKISV